MSEIDEYLSNSTESCGEKRVINNANLSESLRLKESAKWKQKHLCRRKQGERKMR